MMMMMLRLALIALSLSLSSSQKSTSTLPPITSTSSVPTATCDNDNHKVTYTVTNAGQTLTLNPETFDLTCGSPPDNQTSYITVNGTEDMDFYILFTSTKLQKKQKVSVLYGNGKQQTICKSDDFCSPVVLLDDTFTLVMPVGDRNVIQVVVVATSSVSFTYYAYSRLPGWAVIGTLLILFGMTLLCCCCVLGTLRRDRAVRTVSTAPARRRNISDDPPVYSTTYPTFDLPPMYVAREETSVIGKTSPSNWQRSNEETGS